MRDVAALAGVSLKTVSRVVNDEPGVTEAVRQRVQAAAARLDYRYNRAASNLRRGSSRSLLVGAVLQDLSNSFSAALLRSLEDVARERGLAVVASSLDEDAERERALVHDLVERRVDGLVLMPATDRQDYLVAERRAGLPTVFVDRAPCGVDADSVTVDNRAGAALATRHLLGQGHRRIAFVGDLPGIRTAADRLHGFHDAFAEVGLSADPALVVTGARTPQDAERVLGALLAHPDPPSAVFAGRNDLSTGAIRALRASGCSRRVALVGFDDFPLADLLDPPLTVVRQDVRRIGAAVGEMLLARMDGDASAPRHLEIEPTLVVRGSGEVPPDRPPLA